jgi:hypothetical protein
MGFDVVSPAELDRAAGFDETLADQPIDLRACLKRDLVAVLDSCHGVALLPGWERSSGAQLEAHLACVLNLPFYAAVTGRQIAILHPLTLKSVNPA